VPARWLGNPTATAGRGFIQWMMGWP
jgi:hypothetical protein